MCKSVYRLGPMLYATYFSISICNKSEVTATFNSLASDRQTADRLDLKQLVHAWIWIDLLTFTFDLLWTTIGHIQNA